ncbi:MAG: 4a-hydroxytetrahydrobiopterin dehydratase [Actinomycetota bacterium]|nr:4a-hydroxytetrahydrobiopterin dehydratase [Actinomycetota bacterium]
MATLTEQEIRERLAGLDGWTTDGTSIDRRFEFEDFNAAMKFMVTAAPKIDALNHHPEWTNVYNRVDVRLTSHDAGGVTDRDLELALLLDSLAAPQG